MEVGQKIRVLRKKKGLTQIQLAKALHLKDASISHYENDERMPSIDTLIKIANYFDVDISFILGINNSGYSKSKSIRMSDDEVKFILELRKTSSYKNMISNPRNYARLIEMKTSGYKTKI